MQPFQTTSSLSFLHMLPLKVPHSIGWVTVCLITLSMTFPFSLLSLVPTTFTTQNSSKRVLSLNCCPGWVRLSRFHLGRSNFTSPIFLCTLAFLKSTVIPQRTSWFVKLAILFSCFNPFKTILLIQFSSEASLFFSFSKCPCDFFCHNFVFILWEFHTVHYYMSFLALNEILHIIFYILGLRVSYGILLFLFIYLFLAVDCLQKVHGSWYDPLVLLRCEREYESWGLVAELHISVETPLDWLERLSPLVLPFSGSLVKQWMGCPHHIFLPW